MNKPHPHRELIHKWAEGAEIQVRRVGGWIDVPFPSWFKNEEYRIKPEPIKYYGWVHICKYDDLIRYVGSTIYCSHELALQNKPTNCVKIIRIEWEE